MDATNSTTCCAWATTRCPGAAAWRMCGKGPALEEDIALTNVGARPARPGAPVARLRGRSRRPRAGERGPARVPARRARFRNLLLVEQPNGNYADTMARQFLFDPGTTSCCAALRDSSDARIAEIAAKVDQGSDAITCARSGDWSCAWATAPTNRTRKMQAALDDLWTYTGEMFELRRVDAGAGRAAASRRPSRRCAQPWLRARRPRCCAEATLTMPPADAWIAARRQAGRAHASTWASPRRDAVPAARLSGRASGDDSRHAPSARDQVWSLAAARCPIPRSR